ncbi:hypothetical protein IVB44_30070 [Bradyrhizobium sp. 49]|uniref:hypothetical protein n=1 Tax=unclassified Bradyrhizobium TaxID=2631580 RepID=UPI001FFB5DF8|nr:MULTISPECIES: hypothetical protein [unclassified Bradyrhizobium]MCK1270348.1 hypothetical protein [Bradyrhizobium sp. 84]MCK1375134.1 hypothetical protein [Bradyrhizobium sp. 49]
MMEVILAPQQTMAAQDDEVPLNASALLCRRTRRQRHGRRQQPGNDAELVSRYLSLLRDYLGADLIEQVGGAMI